MVTCLRKNSSPQRSHHCSLSVAAHSWPILAYAGDVQIKLDSINSYFCKGLPNCLPWQPYSNWGKELPPYLGLYYCAIKILTGFTILGFTKTITVHFCSVDFCKSNQQWNNTATFLKYYPCPPWLYCNWLNTTTWVVTWLVIWQFEHVLF